MERERWLDNGGTLSILPAGPVEVGASGTWTIEYRLGAVHIRQGGVVRLDVPACFTPPQPNIRRPGGVVVETSNPCVKLVLEPHASRGCSRKDRRAAYPYRHQTVFARVIEGELGYGDRVLFHYGVQHFLEGVATAPSFVGRHEFRVAVDCDGTGAAPYSGFWLVAAATLVTVAGPASGLHLLVPSTVLPGEEVPCLVRVCDAHRNTCETFEGDVHLCTGEGAFEVPGRVVFTPDDRGVKRVMVRVTDRPGGRVLRASDACERLAGRSNVATAIAGGEERIFWGDLHVHTALSDGLGTPEECYRYARDESGLDFCALTDHAQYLTDEDWARIQDAAGKFNVPGAFVTLLGYEVSHNDSSLGERWMGDKNIYFAGDSAPILREREWDADAYNDIVPFMEKWKAAGAMMILHQHAYRSGAFYDPDFVRLVEIYSCWGISEKMNDLRPLFPARDHFGRCVSVPHLDYVQDLLAKGWLLGFVGSSDDHGAHPGNTRWLRYRNGYWGGLAAVLAKELTRESIWQSLWNRRCYATTGARIVLDFRADGHPMGSALARAEHPMITMAIDVHGTADLGSVTLVGDNTDICTWTSEGSTLSAVYAETPGRLCSGYYVRVVQADGEMAWSSPIFLLDQKAPDGAR